MDDRAIGIFDSGVGGLKVLAALKKRMPRENYIYVFDRSHSPYGNKSSRQIQKCVNAVSRRLMSEGVKAIVVACNTATGVGIRALREKFGIPFIGVEPPVKPAAKECGGGKILVLCTRLTAKQDRFIELVKKWDNGNVIVAPQSDLARKIESGFSGLSELKGDVDAILSEYDNDNIESVVLGCTHYYYVSDMIKEHYGGKVKIYDALEGVTKRTESVLTENGLLAENNIGKVKYIYL